MNNIFRPSRTNERPPASAMLKRAGFFAAALVLLWLAVELMPTSSSSTPVVHETDEGSIAFKAEQRAPIVKPGMVGAVVLLLGGVVLAVVLRKKSVVGEPTGHLETLADMPITPDQRLRLLRCGNDVLLVGITAGGVSVLEKYRADAFDREAAPEPGITPAFADLLREAAGRYRVTNRN